MARGAKLSEPELVSIRTTFKRTRKPPGLMQARIVPHARGLQVWGRLVSGLCAILSSILLLLNYDPILDGIVNEFRISPHAHLLQNTSPVGAYGLVAQG